VSEPVADAGALTGAVLASRLGLFGGGEDPALARRVVLGLIAVYALSFALFYPQMATNDDESSYLRQARVMLTGKPTVSQIHPATGRSVELLAGTYPPGTALAMAPLMSMFGWRAGFVIPCLSLLLSVWLTLLWIREAGQATFFALVVLGFPPALVMGRVAMSDVPSAAVVALGCWLFWRGQQRHPGWWLAAGLVAGLSLSFRTTNPLFFLPLFAGTVLRREKRCWALIVGGVAALGLHVLALDAFCGSGVFERNTYRLAFGTVGDRLPIYLIGLLLFVPGGLVFSLMYRGRRRPEIIATIVVSFFFFLFQHFSTQGTSFEKRLVLAIRYFIPLMPVMAFAMSESVPRWLASLERRGGGAARLAAGLGMVAVVWATSVGVAAAAVHPAFRLWSSTQAEIRDQIVGSLPANGVYITNWKATRKFIDVIEQRYASLDRDQLTPRDVQALVRKWGEVYIVLVYRNDSEHWRADAQRSDDFVAGLRGEPELLLDERVSSIERVRILRLARRAPRAAK